RIRCRECQLLRRRARPVPQTWRRPQRRGATRMPWVPPALMPAATDNPSWAAWLKTEARRAASRSWFQAKLLLRAQVSAQSLLLLQTEIRKERAELSEPQALEALASWVLAARHSCEAQAPVLELIVQQVARQTCWRPLCAVSRARPAKSLLTAQR